MSLPDDAPSIRKLENTKMLLNRPMSNDEIQAVAPSAFAGQPYGKQSDRYSFIPKSAVIDGMRNAGYMPVKASQSSSRIPGKSLFTKHMIRFRAENESLTRVGETAMEMV